MRKLVLCLLLFPAVCLGEEVKVTHYTLPPNPQNALEFRAQATVRVEAKIRRKNGKVISVRGKLVSLQEGLFPIEPEDKIHESFISVAEENIRQWVFSPSSHTKNGSMNLTVEYVFSIEGEPVDNPKPRYSIIPPNHVEIITQPLKFIGDDFSIPGPSPELVPLPSPELIPPKTKSK